MRLFVRKEKLSGSFFVVVVIILFNLLKKNTVDGYFACKYVCAVFACPVTLDLLELELEMAGDRNGCEPPFVSAGSRTQVL